MGITPDTTCTDKASAQYKNGGEVNMGIQSLSWRAIVMTSCTGLSRDGSVACGHEVNCRRCARLLRRNLEVGVYGICHL